MDTMILKPTSEADVPFLLDLRRRALVPHEVAAGMQRSEEEHKAGYWRTLKVANW